MLRQSFVRLAARSRREVSRLIHTSGHKQALREVRRMRTYVVRLHRDIGRKIAGQPDLEAAFRPVGEPIARLLAHARQLGAERSPRKKCMTCPARARIDFVLTTAVRLNVSGLSRVGRCCGQAMMRSARRVLR